MKGRRLRLGFASVLCALTLTAGTVTVAHGATIVVNSVSDTADPGNCTLREAITAANTNTPVGACTAGSPYPAVDTITIGFSRLVCLTSGCTIALQSPLPTISEDVIITGGTGAFSGLVTINGGNAYRVFDVQGNDVTIAHLAVINGSATGVSTAALRRSDYRLDSGGHIDAKQHDLFGESCPNPWRCTVSTGWHGGREQLYV